MIKSNRKSGFTLVELLAVVVILGVSFLFIIPNLSSLVERGDQTKGELVEEKILVAAKDYINNYNSSFFKGLVKEGDTQYIYESELLKYNLLKEEDLEELENFVGVKVELLANDKLRYTIEYKNE